MSYKEMFQHIIDELYGDSAAHSVSWFEQYKKQIALGALICVAGGAGAWYFVHERSNARYKATEALFETLQESQEADRAQGNDAWKRVEETAQGGLSMFGSSAQGGYFNALMAGIDHYKGDDVSARVAMEKAASLLSSSDPVKDIYAISAARMDLDHADTSMQEKAIKVLRAYADNKQSHYQDMAQYYLGLWYMHHDNVTEAHKILSELIASQEKFEGKDEYSPWAQAGRELMGQVSL
jgi:hypothetical protein